MKSRKKLKKEIRWAFIDLYKEIVFYNTFVMKADLDKSDAVLAEALDAENELIRRVNINEGKEVKGRVQKYFTELRSDLKNKTSKLARDITNLPQ